MQVLDLDLDYFNERYDTGIKDSVQERLPEEDYGGSVWSERRVRRFLEDNLGLSKIKKIKGRIVKHHNESLLFWENLIAEGKLDWKSPIKEFQPILNKSIKKAEKVDNMSNFINRKCPECGGNLVYRFTKDKGIRFIGCNNYPKCKYNEFPNAFQPKKTGLKCPECGGDLVIKISKRKRKFVGCSNYPTCNFIMKTDSGMIKTIETAVNENKIPDVKVEKAVFEKKVIKQKENKKK